MSFLLTNFVCVSAVVTDGNLLDKNQAGDKDLSPSFLSHRGETRLVYYALVVEQASGPVPLPMLGAQAVWPSFRARGAAGWPVLLAEQE